MKTMMKQLRHVFLLLICCLFLVCHFNLIYADKGNTF